MKPLSNIIEYIAEVRAQLATGHALEHAYRPGLQKLLNSLDDVISVNDPKQSDYGAPDFILLRETNQDLVLGYGEAKDVTVSLDKVERSEQFQRYSGYEKLFITNYLDFRFYENGVQTADVSIATLRDGRLVMHPDNFPKLWDQLAFFIEATPTQIRSGQELARIMGAKARRIRDEVLAIVDDPLSEQERLRKTMKKMLVHDLSKEKFSDLYAQTLVYGLFVARFNDPTPDTFTREEARDLVPTATPFLRVFFDHIAGATFEKRLRRTVEELCQVFAVTDIAGIFARFANSKSGRRKDPVIYFYEDFLDAYDKKIRKEMGAFYTPLPVVDFIVDMIDQVLKEYFDAPYGLADTSKRTIEVFDGQQRRYKDRKSGKTKTTKSQLLEYHRVQVLDPAVGTGTFLNEVIKKVHKTLSDNGQESLWNSYVKDSLLPRIHGFEYMMAPYTIGHLKLGLTLKELGFNDVAPPRLGIYLTNSLEPGIPQPTDLFSLIGLSDAISTEAHLASVVKNEKPLLVILGNPPYLGESNNDTEYAEALIEKYRKEPGSAQRLQEANYKWLRNDYVKFLAMAEDRVNELGEGIVGMITPNSYLSMPTFRGMRYQLLESFDRLYVLDLHGSVHSRDTDVHGKADQNVFDIETGVSILVAVKTSKIKSNLAEVYHHSIKGSRAQKFELLESGNIKWTKLDLHAPMYAFRQFSDVSYADSYEQFIPLKSLFPLHSLGILTKRDKLVVSMTKKDLQEKIETFFDPSISDIEACNNFGLKLKDKDKWDAVTLRDKYEAEDFVESIEPVHFRPFDQRFVVYNSELVARTNERVLGPLKHDNFALVVGRQGQAVKDMEWNLTFIVNKMSDQNIFGRGGGTVFPIYSVSTEDSQIANLDRSEFRKLTAALTEEPTPIDVIHYVYGVLNCIPYRKTFHDFLKDDFPRIPIPANNAEFVGLRNLGQQLAELHTGKIQPKLVTTFPVAGSNEVETLKYDVGRLYINKDQYLENVPFDAWNYHIGGYQVLQKWLKERRGYSLSYDDLLQLQIIIAVLAQSRKLMSDFDASVLSWYSDEETL